MANLKNTSLAVLLGRVTALLVAIAVVAAIGLAAACPWACDSLALGAHGGALRGERCDAAITPPVSVAHHRAPLTETGRPRWHADGDKF